MKTHLKIQALFKNDLSEAKNHKEHSEISSEISHQQEWTGSYYNGSCRYIGPIKAYYWNNLPRLRSLLVRSALIIEQGRIFGENRVFWHGQVIGHENYRFKTLSLNCKIVDIYKEIEQQK